MMSTTRVLVFVVTLMSFINHSYLIITTVELPNINHETFEDYTHAVTGTAALQVLNKDQFKMTLENYNKINAEIDNEWYKRIIREISLFKGLTEPQLLKKIMTFERCEKKLINNIENYIELRKNYYRQTKNEEPIEEIEYLKTLIPLSNTDGRLKSLYLNTLYGSNQHLIHGAKDSFDSMWLYIISKLDPIFGESYMSYFSRMKAQEKMALPQQLIPKFYGKGKLELFDDFDIWPELNGAFVMYYLFNCPFDLSNE